METLRCLALLCLMSLFRKTLSEVKQATYRVFINTAIKIVKEILPSKLTYLEEGNLLVQDVVDHIAYQRALYHSREGTEPFESDWIRFLIVPCPRIFSERETQEFGCWFAKQKEAISELAEGAAGEIIAVGVACIHEEFLTNKAKNIHNMQRESQVVVGFLVARGTKFDGIKNLEAEFHTVKFITDPKSMSSIVATRYANSSTEEKISLADIEGTDVWVTQYGYCSAKEIESNIKAFLTQYGNIFPGQLKIRIVWTRQIYSYNYEAKNGENLFTDSYKDRGPMIVMAWFPTGIRNTENTEMDELAFKMTRRMQEKGELKDIEIIRNDFAMKLAHGKASAYKYDRNACLQTQPLVDSPKFARIIMFPIQDEEFNISDFMAKFMDFIEKMVSAFPKSKGCIKFGFSLNWIQIPDMKKTVYIPFMVFFVEENDMLYLRRKIDVRLDCEATLLVNEYARTGRLPDLQHRVQNVPAPCREVLKNFLPSDFERLQEEIAQFLLYDKFGSVAIGVWPPPNGQDSDSAKTYIAVIYINSFIGEKSYILPKLSEEKNLFVRDFTETEGITPLVIDNMYECLFMVRRHPAREYDEFMKVLNTYRSYVDIARQIAIDTINKTPLEKNLPHKVLGCEGEDVNLSDPLETLLENILKKHGDEFRISLTLTAVFS